MTAFAQNVTMLTRNVVIQAPNEAFFDTLFTQFQRKTCPFLSTIQVEKALIGPVGVFEVMPCMR